jgi:hypothetical protein
MDYKKMWNTLKAESGYRLTRVTLCGNKKYDQSISHLMKEIELRDKECHDKQQTKLLSSIESILVSAGESCPDDYQNGFNWAEYMKSVNQVKKEVIEYSNTFMKH